MIFENRQHAGELLSKELLKLKLDLKKSIICAIPRGGVLVGKVISQNLNIPLCVIVIKKIGALHNPELAIGATASFGKPVLDRWLMRDLGVSREYLKREILKKRKEARARENFLQAELLGSDFAKKNVVVVDDGAATGQTARAAAKIIRMFAPERLILAIGCASPSSVGLLRGNYDEIICPEISEELFAVGQFYRDFRPVKDEEVKAILNIKD